MNSILSSFHCFPSSVSPWFSPQWALPFCPSTNSFAHFKAHTGLLSQELCSSQPHSEIATAPHALSRFLPPVPYPALVSRILTSLGSANQGPMLLQASLPCRDGLTAVREPRATLSRQSQLYAQSPHAQETSHGALHPLGAPGWKLQAF